MDTDLLLESETELFIKNRGGGGGLNVERSVFLKIKKITIIKVKGQTLASSGFYSNG